MSKLSLNNQLWLPGIKCHWRQQIWKNIWCWVCKGQQCVCVCAFVCVCVHTRSCSVVSDSFHLHGLYPARLIGPWDFPAWILDQIGQFLLQGISLPMQGSNLHSLISALAGGFFTISTTWEALKTWRTKPTGFFKIQFNVYGEPVNFLLLPN